ncbi:MAG: hypothetical protein ACXWTU_01760, partial [Methylotenera sp.]
AEFHICESLTVPPALLEVTGDSHAEMVRLFGRWIPATEGRSILVGDTSSANVNGLATAVTMPSTKGL